MAEKKRKPAAKKTTTQRRQSKNTPRRRNTQVRRGSDIKRGKTPPKHKREQGKKTNRSNRPNKPNKRTTKSGDTYVVHPKDIKPPAPDTLRVVVVGGAEEVGRNCTLLEYNNDIIMIDMGLQFPEEDMPGVDYIIPNMSYLKGREKKIRGVVITHGHLDHIGGIPHTVPKIGNPPVYGLPITNAIIRKRQDDYKVKLKLQDFKLDDVIKLGAFKVSFFHVNHNIPDSCGVVVETPTTTLVHTGDWKFDYHPVDEKPTDFQELAVIGSKGVDVLMGDSTNAASPGHTISEKVVGEELARLIEKAPGRVIIGTFSSLLSRVKQAIEIAEKNGKIVAVDGYSMKTNVEIAKKVGFIKCKASTLVPIDKVNNYPDEKVIVMCTGAQGESNAALMRIANKEHKSVRLHEGDTVIFSSSIVPGNESSVARLTDSLYKQGAKVINYKMMDVHASGHAHQEDIKLMIKLMKPKYYIPIEGNHLLLKNNAMLAESLGWDKEHVFVTENGQIMEFKGGNGKMRREKMPSDYVFVDGLGVGDVSDVVLRDRNELAADGMIVIVVQIDGKTGNLVGSPDVISRGFVHMRENRDLINGVKDAVKRAANKSNKEGGADDDFIREQIRNHVGQFAVQKTQRRPMVLPIVIRV